MIGGWFPEPYQIVVVRPRWLSEEVPYEVHLQVILRDLKGWRSREVYEYLQSYDWTARMYEDS